MRNRDLACVALTVLASSLAPAAVLAEDLQLSTTTLMRGAQEVRDRNVRNVAPAYFMLSTVGRGIRNPLLQDVKVVLSAWGRLDPGDIREQQFATGDVNLAFVEGNVFSKRVEARVGRQLLINGPTRLMQLDGVEVTAAPFQVGPGVSMYAGTPVRSRFQLSLGDAVAGARVFWRQSFDTEVGASVIHTQYSGRVARQDFAVDARHMLHRTLTLSAYGVMTLPRTLYGIKDVLAVDPSAGLNGGLPGSPGGFWPLLVEADLAATWQPIRAVQFMANYRRMSPELFLDRSSIMWVFVQSRYDEAGASLYLSPLKWLKLDAAYHVLMLDVGPTHRGGLNGTLVFGPGQRTQIGTGLRFLTAPGNGFAQTRLYLRHRPLAGLTAMIDLDNYVLHQAVNGQRLAFTTMGGLMYQFLPGWSAGFTASAGTTPYLAQRLEVLARVGYRMDVRLRELLP